MPVFAYSPEVRMAIADDPFFPGEGEASFLAHWDGLPLILQEWRIYFVKFYGDSVPDFFPQSGFYTQRKFPGHLFEITFRNVVGMTRIGPVQVRVEGAKISDLLYEAMLNYLTEKYANLVFSFTSPVGQGYRKEKPGQDISYIEYLFLKKYLLDSSPNLDGITSLILANPHHHLTREFRYNSLDEVAYISHEMMIQMFNSADRFSILRHGHPLLSTTYGGSIFGRTGRRLYPAEVVEEKKHHSVDTKENQFIKFFLQLIQRRLNKFKRALEGVTGGYLNPDIEIHLGKMERGIGAFLADPFWQDVGAMDYLPVSSQILQRRDGYRQLFNLYSLLQLSSHCDFNSQDFKNLLETKDTPTLFEYWSFCIIKDILDNIRKMISCQTIVSAGPLEQRINPGIHIRYEGGISLWFNRSFSGSPGFTPSSNREGMVIINESYSHTLRPDIVLSKGDKLLIFDAKFKGERNGFYGEDIDGKISSWKEEDIDKMHTYREAIRGVRGAYILYPGEKPIIFSAPHSEGLWEGVGALPLKPETGERPVQKHLDELQIMINNFI